MPAVPAELATSIDRIGVCLAAILAAAPLLPRGPTYFGLPKLTYVEAVLPALAIVWLAAIVTNPRRPREHARVPLWPWDVYAAAMIGATILGLMAENPLTSPVFASRLRVAITGELFAPMHQTAHPLYPLRVGLTLLEGWLVARLLADTCRRAIDPARRARTALAGLGAGLAVVAAFAAVQYVTRFQLLPYWVKANPALARAHSTLDDPNALGACLVLGLGLIVGLLRLDVSDRRRRWLALGLVGIAGLVATMSRAALGAVVIAPAAVLALAPAPTTRVHRHLRTTARLVIALLAVVTAGSMILRTFATEQRRSNPHDPVDMIVKTFDPRESTGWVLRGRLPWWRAAIAMFEDQPLAGVGLGRYPRLMRAYGGGKVENAHNFFLQLLAESGVVGCASFVALCASMLIGSRRAYRLAPDDRRRAIALGGLVGVLAFLLTLLTGHTLLVPIGQITLASLFVLSVMASGLPAPVAVASGASDRPPLWLSRSGRAMAIAVALVVAPASGLARHVAPRPGEWGYFVGLYNEERSAGGTRYRWTSGKALLDLPVPPGATALVIQANGARPPGGTPMRVRMTAGAAGRDWYLTEPGQQHLRVPLSSSSPRSVLVSIEVEPTFVPAANGTSRDTRALGVKLLVPRFEREAGQGKSNGE